MALDLGKQMGPLPLGAWIAVVAGGLGIAYYTRRSGTAPVAVEDTSGVPGVGTGAVGGWTSTAPATGGTDGVTAPVITTNDEWARQAINWLIAQGYPANVADSAIRKYITGVKLSIQEYALLGVALTKWGAPPTALPPDESEPEQPPPASDPDALGTPNASITAVNGDWVYLQWPRVPGALMYEITCTGAINSGTAGHAFTTYGWWAGKGSGLVTFTVQAKSLTRAGPVSAPISVTI